MTFPQPASLLLAATVTAAAGGAKSPVPPVTGDWEFSLSAGPAWRQAGRLEFDGGSRSGGIFIPSFVGGNVLITPPIGPTDQFGERLYNDGFVSTDPSTDIDGFNTFWGYQNAGQVVGDEISFRATGFQSIRSDALTLGTPSSADRHEHGISPVIQFDASYRHEIVGFRPGFSASLIWTPLKLNRQWSDFALTQTRDDFRHDWTDRYNLGGFGNLVPSAPYAGTPSGPGFTLENIPDGRDFAAVPIGSEDAVVANRVSARFRADQTTFSFGPTLQREISESWSIGGGIGVAIHWLHWSASQTESLDVTKNGKTAPFVRWEEKSSGDAFLGGIYLQVGAEWIPKNQPWSIKSFLRGDLGASFTEQLGPSSFKYGTNGFTAAVMLSHAL